VFGEGDAEVGFDLVASCNADLVSHNVDESFFRSGFASVDGVAELVADVGESLRVGRLRSIFEKNVQLCLAVA